MTTRTQIIELKCLECGHTQPPPPGRFTMDELIRLEMECPRCKTEDPRWVANR